MSSADNLFINFDPANMILYGTGEPIAALKKVGRYVKSVHCKDGKWAQNPGKEWGQEVPLGEGDVGMENYLRTLKEIGYDGPLTIERESRKSPSARRPKSAERSACSRNSRPNSAANTETLYKDDRMPKLSIAIPHELGREQASERMKGFYGTARRKNTRTRWATCRKSGRRPAAFQLHTFRLQIQGVGAVGESVRHDGHRSAVRRHDVQGKSKRIRETSTRVLRSAVRRPRRETQDRPLRFHLPGRPRHRPVHR